MIPGDICGFPYIGNDGLTKYRPVVVVAVGPTGPGEDEVVVIAPITGSAAHVLHPRLGDVVIDDYVDCGLNRLSVIRARQFSGVPRVGLSPRGGDRVSSETLDQVQTIVRGLIPPLAPNLFMQPPRDPQPPV